MKKPLITIAMIVFVVFTLISCRELDENNNETTNALYLTPSLSVEENTTIQPSSIITYIETVVPEQTLEPKEEKIFDIQVEQVMESKIIRALDVPDEYFSAIIVPCSTTISVTEYNNEIYFTNNSSLYRIDDNDKIVLIALIDKLEEMLDLPEWHDAHSIGVCTFNDNLYVMVLVDDPDYNWWYYLYDLTNDIIIDDCGQIPTGYFGNKIVSWSKYDDETGISTFIFDVDNNELIDIEKYNFEYIFKDIVFATDKYIIGELHLRASKSNYRNNDRFVILDANSYEEIDYIDFNELEVTRPTLFKCEGELFYFYDEGNSTVKVYNIKTGELTIITKFNESSRFIKYEADEDKIYLSFHNYKHDLQTVSSANGYHTTSSHCFF